MHLQEKLVNDSIIKDIRDMAEGVLEGTIIITISKRKIIQIDVSHKTRFDDIWQVEQGGGI